MSEEPKKPRAKVWAEVTVPERGGLDVTTMLEGPLSDVLMCLTRMVQAIAEDSGMTVPLICAMLCRPLKADESISIDPRAFRWKEGGSRMAEERVRTRVLAEIVDAPGRSWLHVEAQGKEKDVAGCLAGLLRRVAKEMDVPMAKLLLDLWLTPDPQPAKNLGKENGSDG